MSERPMVKTSFFIKYESKYLNVIIVVHEHKKCAFFRLILPVRLKFFFLKVFFCFWRISSFEFYCALLFYTPQIVSYARFSMGEGMKLQGFRNCFNTFHKRRFVLCRVWSFYVFL